MPLAQVCEQYLAYLALMEALDVEIASEYLVIAATLVFIKSRRLLPPAPPIFVADELAEEAALAEEALRERLIAYQHFKNAGSELRERLTENAAFFARSPAPEEGLTQRFSLDAASIADAFTRALESAAARPAVVKRETFSMVVKMHYVLRLLRERGTVLFSELIADCEKMEIVVTFLAVLELVRLRRVAFEQARLFDDILLARPAKAQLAKPA